MLRRMAEALGASVRVTFELKAEKGSTAPLALAEAKVTYMVRRKA